jgi:phosphoglycolate phosphatase
LLAAKILEIDPKHSLYVGDDLRDIVAGKAAGMQTVAAAYGYCGNHEPPDSWGADHLAYHPTDLIDIIFPKNQLE